MKKKRINLDYYIKEGFSSIFTHGFMSFASICIIMACLIIMGVFSIIILNINSIIQLAENKNEITAYVDERLEDEEAIALESTILSIDNVSNAVFTTKEEAMDNFAEKYSDNVLDGIEPDVLRHRYTVYLDDIALMEQTKNDLKAIDGIANVSAQTEIAQGFVTIRNIVSVVSIALIAILFVISVFIISNTTKLATFDRREEIAIMKMVGATNAFIRWPFVFQGFILGIFAALVSFVILWAGYELMVDWIFASLAGYLISFSSIAQSILIAFVATGFVVGVLGSVVTIRNYLKV